MSPNEKIATFVNVSVNISASPGRFGNVQMSMGIEIPVSMSFRVSEIILKRLNEMRDRLIADLKEGV
jgi:hypothetical protein